MSTSLGKFIVIKHGLRVVEHNFQKMTNHLSKDDPRYIRSWKCQVSVGELYRWILAKLSDKDIKRALHKYRDLMPRQSDWNRKLTQATSVPELGFRYLYRCGQIDESNHKTMQKMLKYIDRQDVLPYFDTILYNSNHANCSLEDLQKILLDKVNIFLEYSTVLSEDEVHPKQPYEIIQCQPVDPQRVTRSSLKRKSDLNHSRCLTSAKRIRLSSSHDNPTSPKNPPNDSELFSPKYWSKIRSAIVANALSGPIVHAMLSTSLISMLASLRTTLSQALENPNLGLASSIPSTSSARLPTQTSSSSTVGSLSANLNALSSANLLAVMPYLLAVARINPLPYPNPPLNPSPSLMRAQPANLGPPIQPQQHQHHQLHHNHQQQQQRLIGPRFVPNRPIPNGEHRPELMPLNRPVLMAPVLGQVRPPIQPNLPEIGPALAGIRIPLIGHHQNGPEGDRPNGLLFVPQPNGPIPEGVHQPVPHQPVQLKQVVLSAGGVGITASPHDSLIQYYCNIKLRVTIDFGPSAHLLSRIQSDRQELFERQFDLFLQASNLLRSRSTGEFICNLRFSQLNQLEAFWADYQSGFLRHFLMDMLLSPTSRSFVGRSTTVAQQPSSSGTNDPGSQPENPNRPQASNWMHDPNLVQEANLCNQHTNLDLHSENQSTTEGPHSRPSRDTCFFNIMTRAIEKIRHREPSNASSSPAAAAAAVAAENRNNSDHANYELNLFVSRREYENGRCLLMRNLRAIPSLCRLVAASCLIPSPESISPKLHDLGNSNTSNSINSNMPSSTSYGPQPDPNPAGSSNSYVVS